MVEETATYNKVAVSYNCKKLCTTQWRHKCSKNNIKCLWYCFNPCQDCSNIRLIYKGIKVTVCSKRTDGDDGNNDNNADDEEGNVGEMNSKAQLEKPKKRARILTNSNCKQKKITSLP